MTSTAALLHQQATEVMPGGVSATARRNAALGHPFYIARGAGALVYDLDGRDYVDLCCSHGASLLGHGHPATRAAVQHALELGAVCAAETEHQVSLARRLRDVSPCAEMARFSSSGTETMMHALRLVRTASGRDKFIKFEGHFHGYSDFLNFSWAPPISADPTTPHPESAGIPRDTAQHVIVVPFNDPNALRAAFAAHGAEVAALIMEPVNYDSGCILPEPGFLQLCRELCDAHGSLLFFDEVLTAFRAAAGGAQELYGVTADLAVLGKAFGAGMPISALVGKRSVMEHMRPLGSCEMSGTYLSHITAVLAAHAALDQYTSPGFYERIHAVADRFYAGFREIIAHSGVAVRLQHCGPRFGLYFGLPADVPVTNYRQAALQDHAQFLRFVRGCIERGVYVHVSAHHGFSGVHTDADMDRALAAFEGALADVRREF